MWLGVIHEQIALRVSVGVGNYKSARIARKERDNV
jgi:hypothetical protein